MTSCPDDTAWQDLIEGRLGQEEIDRIHAHVAECSGCRHMLVELALSETRDPSIPAAGASRASPPRGLPQAARERFGNYVATAPIGAGGMGTVYRAVHPEIGRVVAIKLLRPEIARDDRAVARFFDEARAANAIRHEGIVDVFDLGRRPDGTVYLVMEYLAGEDLASLLEREGTLPPAQAVALIRQVCLSVGAAHRCGIVHRDLKPQNLFIVQRAGRPRVKVLDFGIAKLLLEGSRPVTHTGVVIGTVQYMSPEQATAQPVDARSDLYSIGCILFEMVTGALPFPARNTLEAINARVTRQPERPSRYRRDIPAALEDLILRLLSRDPADRYQDAEELSAALAALDLTPPAAGAPEAAAQEVASASASAIAPAPPRDPEREAPAASPPLRAPPARAEAAARPPSGLMPLPAATDSTDPSLLRQPVPPGASALLQSAPPLIDAKSERRVIKAVIPIIISLFLAGLALYHFPSTGSLLDRGVLRRWLPVFGVNTAVMCGLLVLVVRTQQDSRLRFIVNRLMTLLAVATITVSLYLKGSVTSYDILYYPLLVIIDRLRENRSLARLTMAASMLAYIGLVLAGHAGLIPYAPLYAGRGDPSSRMIFDRGLCLLEMFVVAGATGISYVLTNFLAGQVQRREHELRELGRGLAGRIEEQLQLLRRSERLRRYVSPQLAEAILRGEATDEAGHERRRLTLARLDCPAIARAAEKVDPEEFALLLNALFGQLADLAAAHGGTVDRMSGAEISVLFGAPGSSGAAADAARAVRFSLAALPAVRRLSRQCEVAGVEEEPAARAAVHTGFATVGSFGSPARLEYTAVGPMVEATAALLAAGEPDVLLITHATYALLREQVRVEARGERVLPGTHHAVRLYAAQGMI
jgi:serine/threonine protein kinase/class 3 adenylate cyclase